MNLVKLLNLNKNRIISIVGAGGKTSLLFYLAEQLGEENKVLVTTTTRIYKPETEQMDYFALSQEGFDNFNNSEKNGIYVYGESIIDENKLKGLDCDVLEKQVPYFDYVLIEADGSKRKALKAWRENEPVIVNQSDMIIGVLSLETVAAEINAENIHRVDKFMKITGSEIGEEITLNHFISLVFHEKGLFKDSIGERVLFINKVDKQADLMLAKKLIKKIAERNENYISKIIIGSLKYGKNYN